MASSEQPSRKTRQPGPVETGPLTANDAAELTTDYCLTVAALHLDSDVSHFLVIEK